MKFVKYLTILTLAIQSQSIMAMKALEKKQKDVAAHVAKGSEEQKIKDLVALYEANLTKKTKALDSLNQQQYKLPTQEKLNSLNQILRELSDVMNAFSTIEPEFKKNRESFTNFELIREDVAYRIGDVQQKIEVTKRLLKEEEVRQQQREQKERKEREQEEERERLRKEEEERKEREKKDAKNGDENKKFADLKTRVQKLNNAFYDLWDSIADGKISSENAINQLSGLLLQAQTLLTEARAVAGFNISEITSLMGLIQARGFTALNKQLFAIDKSIQNGEANLAEAKESLTKLLSQAKAFLLPETIATGKTQALNYLIEDIQKTRYEVLKKEKVESQEDHGRKKELENARKRELEKERDKKKQRGIERRKTTQPLSINAEYTYAPRALFIYLDDGERDSGAVSDALRMAIYKPAGPIIASTHCLRVIKSKIKDIPDHETIKTLNTSWIIKQVNDDIVFLIPLEYLNKIGIAPAKVKESNAITITATELALGLKVNHMEEKTFDMIKLSPTNARAKKSDYFLPALFDKEYITSSIFCLRSDYDENYKDTLPLWAIVMEGHGESEEDFEQIVGISLDDFKQVLDFFESKINTRLLFYISCYAADLNNEKIYGIAKSLMQKTYSFPIITQALTNAPTTQTVFFYQPEKFVAAVMVPASNPIDYGKLVDYMGPQKKMAANRAQIKLPGLEWFSVINADKEVVQIGSILAANRGSKPLDIATFFKTNPRLKANPRIVLLYAQDIPFELIINAPNLKSIVSMIPGDTVHTIEKITSSSQIGVILDWFMSIDSLNSKKIFYIKSLNHLKDVIICNIPHFYNEFNKYERFAIFNENGDLYVKEYVFKDLSDQDAAKSSIRKVENKIVSNLLPNKIYSQEMYNRLLEEVRGVSSKPSTESTTLPAGVTGRSR